MNILITFIYSYFNKVYSKIPCNLESKACNMKSFYNKDTLLITSLTAISKKTEMNLMIVKHLIDLLI